MKYLQLVIALAAVATAAGCANPSRSRDLANPKVPPVVTAQQVCSSCHGMNGVSVSPNFPILAAQTPTYLIAQLRDFRAHNRSDPAGFEYMWGISRRLTDEQIQGLADYYAHQPPAPGMTQGNPARVAAGNKIFHEGVAGKNVPACASCHGDNGQGKDQFPRLAGQHADYVVKQLVVFQRTDQRPTAAAMKIVAHELSGQEIEDVASYVQSLP